MCFSPCARFCILLHFYAMTEPNNTDTNTDINTGIDTEPAPAETTASDATRRTDASTPSRTRVIVGWILVAVMACLIFMASAHSGLDLDQGNGLLARAKRWLTALLSDAVGHTVDVSLIGHFTEYFLFGCTLANALWSSVPKLHGRWAGLALSACGIASLYGVTDEFHQFFVPGRSTDPVDWCCDTIAALIGAAIVAAVIRRRHRSPQP